MITIIDHDIIPASYPVVYQSIEFVKDNKTGEIVRHRGQPVTRPIEEVRMHTKFHYRFTIESEGEMLPALTIPEIVNRFGRKPFSRAKRTYIQKLKAERRENEIRGNPEPNVHLDDAWEE